MLCRDFHQSGNSAVWQYPRVDVESVKSWGMWKCIAKKNMKFEISHYRGSFKSEEELNIIK